MINIIRRYRHRRTLKAVALEARHWADINQANVHHYSTLLGSLRYMQAKDDPFDPDMADRIAEVASILARAEELADQYDLEAMVAEHRYAAVR